MQKKEIKLYGSPTLSVLGETLCKERQFYLDDLGSVVQSIASLTKSLGKDLLSLTVLIKSTAEILIFAETL